MVAASTEEQAATVHNIAEEARKLLIMADELLKEVGIFKSQESKKDSSCAKVQLLSFLISFIYDLNPFFKFDGYWITSDILGVPNLREKTKEIFTYYFRQYIKQEKTKEMKRAFEAGRYLNVLV